MVSTDRAYIAHGIRAQASDVVTRQLGRQTELEVQQELGREVDHDGFTRLDRTLPGALSSALRAWGVKLAKRVGSKKACVAAARKLAIIMRAARSR